VAVILPEIRAAGGFRPVPAFVGAGRIVGCWQDVGVDPVLVVGAGISGIAAARALRAADVPVVVLDRGKRIGGRMAVRTTDDRPVDTGASYFTVSDPAFEAVVRDWQQRGLARPWTDTFHVYDRGELTTKSGPVRWAAPRGLRSLVEDLAVGLELRQQQVRQVEPGPMVDEEPAAAVVLAMPDPQAERLLHPSFGAEIEALTDPFDPVLVLTASWPQRSWPADVDGVFVQHDDALTWVADDGRRRGDGAPVLVAHSTPELARQHLDQPQDAGPELVAALQRVLGIREAPASSHVHRWTFAKPAGTRDHSFHLGPDGIGFCGDAWSDKPRVESAFLSGAALAAAIVQRLGQGSAGRG
jgi:renalase